MPASNYTRSASQKSFKYVLVAHHDRLALILEDVTGAANLVAASQAQEHQLIGWIYRLYIPRLHSRMLPFGSHVCVFTRLQLDY